VSAPAARRPLQWAIKRALDVTGAAAGLAVLSPALLLLGAAVRLDSPGGALFRQERVGRDGRTFAMIKLRTMQAGAPVQYNPDGSTRVAAVDARVTRVGRLLRGGLDELPQLVNVLRGDMSLVGPRPDLPVHAATYTAAERGKLVVRPGMVSLAAVLGRNEIAWRTRMAIDLRYLERWSLALDFQIIAQTLLLPLGWRPFRFRRLVGDLLGS
jgi:lipopolysaccharide/colanic/teichoic acid biosynthesis glycosyltransferase